MCIEALLKHLHACKKAEGILHFLRAFSVSSVARVGFPFCIGSAVRVQLRVRQRLVQQPPPLLPTPCSLDDSPLYLALTILPIFSMMYVCLKHGQQHGHDIIVITGLQSCYLVVLAWCHFWHVVHAHIACY